MWEFIQLIIKFFNAAAEHHRHIRHATHLRTLLTGVCVCMCVSLCHPSNTLPHTCNNEKQQEMLDPTVGEGVVTAMRKEVHRMELRHAELMRVQERLMQV